MARQQRSTTLAQESTRPIAQVALYARVSTLNNQDPEMQLAELREYAGRRGWQIVEEFTDQGVSGCKESRPALNRLMSDACRRRFDAILVWKIDRFGRSLKHLVNALAELAALGVAFVSLRDNLDLSTPSGRLISDHRRHGRIRARVNPRAGPCRVAECTRQGQTTRETARDCGRLPDCLFALSWTLLGPDHG
jgi:hypothetical protein